MTNTDITNNPSAKADIQMLISSFLDIGVLVRPTGFADSFVNPAILLELPNIRPKTSITAFGGKSDSFSLVMLERLSEVSFRLLVGAAE
jgi:hypothetical protein